MGNPQIRNQMAVALVGMIAFQLFFFHVCAKECTNSPASLPSHSLRYEIYRSQNETWKQELLSHYHHHDDHVPPTDDSAWANLGARKLLIEEDDQSSWNVLYRKMKHPDQFKLEGDFLKEVPLHNVRLEPHSIHWRAQQTNLEYLLWLDVDRLVWSFRNNAGLKTPGTPYGGWEAPDVQLRGHFVGHYLSATAQMWASTRNETVKHRMNSLISALKECQDKIGTGYLSAFPSEYFDRFETLQYVWAPYYTIHKIMQGLLDQYTFTGNPQPLKMLIWMVDYFYKRVQNVIVTYTIERQYASLNEEVGGMNDVLYQLYKVTGNQKHLVLAHLFDKPCFLGLLAVKADDLSGFHANTHIPLVVGGQMRYEVTGDELYRDMGKYFMYIVNASYTYATGGTTDSEHWRDPKRLATTLSTENEESCTTYNMLKVSRIMFRWTKDVKYADYYERAFTNGVLSIQRGVDPGIMIYMLPLGHGVSKAESYHGWGTMNNSFWCCYGTGIESFSKLGDSIYFEEGGKALGLYVIQYISSSLNWVSGKISLTQKVNSVVSWDQNLRVTLTVSRKQGSGASTLNLRVPSWTDSSGASSFLNGEKLVLPSPGSFLSVTKNWKNGDQIKLEFPLTLRTEAIEDDRANYTSLHAILYGPYLLAGLTTGDYDIKVGGASDSVEWISPIPSTHNSQLITLSQGEVTLFMTRTNGSITLEAPPLNGSDSVVHATFRLVSKDSSLASRSKRLKLKDLIGQVVRLEPFDHPGMAVAHNGEDKDLVISNDNGDDKTEFRILKALNGDEESLSFESASKKGCFINSGETAVSVHPGLTLKLICSSSSSRGKKNVNIAAFGDGASFAWSKGMRSYNPISFVAKGEDRSYLLEPIISLRDESYNVYFNLI